MAQTERERIAELIKKSREKLEASKQKLDVALPERFTTDLPSVVELFEDEPTPIIPEAGTWEWNPEQLEAIGLAKTGKSFVMIGAAGTGKTTTEREIATQLIASGLVPPLDMNTKYLEKGLPGIVFTSFTRRAVRNSRKVVSEDIKPHCITLHKLLEYGPVFYDVTDPATGETRKTMRFEPMRNSRNKLPATLKTIVIDESSMVDTDLFLKLIAALPNPDAVQFIFVGDLHQLPPVYGSAILGFKLLDLPVVELTRIYRQAAKSPIITLAHKIKNGQDVPVTTRITEETEQGKVTLHPWKKPLSDFDATHTASLFLKKLVESGEYDEEEDIILCPQEKTKNLAFGTNEFNKIIAQALGERRKEPEHQIVHEIVAGYILHYYAIGDRILVGREDAIITKITKNARYWGKRPRTASNQLDRWGNYKSKVASDESDDFDIDKYLESFTLDSGATTEERKQEASHIITVQLLDSGEEETLSTAGDINAAQFAYCLTVHKSQGSEWNRVFFLTHNSHVVMWNRELLYTAITRARKELYCIIEPDRGPKPGTLTKAARSPRIKGDTLAEKAEYFKGKSDAFTTKLEGVLAEEQGEAHEGTNVNRKEEAPPKIEVSEKPPVKLVKLGDYVSAQFKHEAREKLKELWTRARMIWGDRIGDEPILDFGLQRARTIGLASPSNHTIYLNSLWCIVADEDEWVRKDMLNDTIPHEVAHLVNAKYSFPAGKGHDGGWVMAAKLLGMANPEATTNEYPDWAEKAREISQEILRKKFEEIKAQGNEVDYSDTAGLPNDVEA